MQISRMPIPADDCGSTEMSVESNASDTKSVPETIAKVNGECHKNLNGSADDDTKAVDKTSEVVVEEEAVKEKEPEIKTEPMSECLDEHVQNGECELQEPKKNIVETSEETNKEKQLAVDDTEVKVEPINIKIDNDEPTPMEIDESENLVESQQHKNLVIVKEEPGELEESTPKVTEDVATLEKEAFLSNGEINQDNEVIKNNIVVRTNPVNGESRPGDEEKNIKTEKVGQKVSVEEDVSSEISTDTLSPKQTDEPIARKRSAASHDDFSVVSGASSDNDLPKIKKLRSEDEVSVIKDDIRERLIKNIVQSCGKNEVELSKNIDKIQNEIKVITEIAQTKREELVTLIRLQKLKEEIIERLMIKVKEFDAAKTDNSKDWNLPEMFQINLSQPELLLNEKNITDIIESRETQFEKSAIGGYDQNSYTTSLSNMSVNSVALASNSQSNDWIVADRANRVNRGQRIILPKPTIINNGKEGRQGPTLDVKLLIADHRSKNPEAAVPKRGRRKAPVNEFSVPTSSGPLRYPNPMGFGNPIHHVNDGNFKTTINNSHGVVPNNVMDHGSEHNRFKDAPAFPEVTLHPVSQTLQSQQQHQQQQQTSLLHGILTKGAGTHHLPITMSNTPTNYSPTLARLLTAPERCKQSRGKQRQTTPAATVVSSNTQSRNEITITPVQSTSMSSTFLQKPSITSNILPAQVDDEDASDRLVIDEGQDVLNANSPTSAPQCQGCLQKPAQFVCAGCGNQWYCSKDCQIDAWDEHSEVCSG